MATRPDTLKVLTKAVEAAKSQVSKLDAAKAQAEAALANPALPTADVGLYKDAVKTAIRLAATFTKALEITLPSGQLSPAKRGRPPKAANGTAVVAKAKAKPAKAVSASADAPKRRGRPPKVKVNIVTAAVLAEASTPKKRGRPPKAKVEAVAAPVSAEAPVAKRRGRPPKAKPEASVSAAN